MVKALLFDLDGVLYQGEGVIEGAVETLAWVRAQAIPHLFLTNTSSRPRSQIVDKLARMGIDVSVDEILTPPVAAVVWLKTRVQGDVALFVPQATREEFATLPLLNEAAESGAAAVVVGDLGQGWDFATLNRAFRLLIDPASPQLIALGMTRYWSAPDGLRLDVAPFIAALECAAGSEAIVLGKPAAPFFQAALDRLGQAAADTIMVGDDVLGDVEGAQAAGIRGVLVRTGKFRPSDLERGIEPCAVLGSIADLPRWWEQRTMET